MSTNLENLYLTQPVVHRGCDLGSASCVAIMMHGRDRDTDDILQIADRLDLDHIAYLAPAAHENSWYPGKFARGFHYPQIVLAGFSQGACVVSEYSIRHARRYGGIIIFTGGFTGPEGTRWDSGGDFKGTPVFLGCSDIDEWIPERRVHETADVMKKMGADVEIKIYKGMEHIINDDEIIRARRIFQSVLNTA